MTHFNAHQQLFNTQCGGLSSCWARAARDEAREAAHGDAQAAGAARSGLLRKAAGIAGVACAAGAAGMLVLWMSALPLDGQAPRVDQVQVVSTARAPA